MHQTLHVLVETLAMVYIFIKMHLAFHILSEPWLWLTFLSEYARPLTCSLVIAYIPFETHMAMAMVNIFVKMHLTLHVPFGTLVMVYVPFEMHLALTMVNFFIKMHLAHNNILNVSSKTQTKKVIT
jgi:hypothetical protein